MSKSDEVVVPRFALETVMKIINGKGIYGAGIDALNTALAATPSPVAGGINAYEELKLGGTKASSDIYQYKFQNVKCSQCGGEFGPGDYGFSHCKNHKHLPRLG